MRLFGKKDLKKNSVLSVKGLVVNEGKVLVLYRADTKNSASVEDLPGGILKHGEEPQLTLLRKMDEELGVHVHIKKLISQGTINDRKIPNITCMVFLCEYISGDVHLTMKHQRYEWVDVSEFRRQQYPKWIMDAVKKIQ